MTASKWVLLALAFSLCTMKPPVSGQIVPVDIIFLLLGATFLLDCLRDKARFRWRNAYWVLATYLAGLSASLISTSDAGRSLFKLATQFYLIGLAVIADQLIDDWDDFRRVSLAWLAGAAVSVSIAVAALLSFPFAPDGVLMRWTRFHFGTLPPGNYPRLASTYFDVNMYCNYLTASLGVLLVAAHQGWIARWIFLALLAGILVAALFTISPGLGGIALALGLWIYLSRGSRIAALLGITAAIAFLAATAVTPILHSTAPFTVTIPGTDLVLAPSGRFLTWTAAVREFAAHPLVGHGIGIDPVDVRYFSPSGYMQTLNEAHNSFLSVAAQCGVVGLTGLLIVVCYAVRQAGPWRPRPAQADIVGVGIGLTFLNAFVYQGLGSASFEDARHLWFLFGLLIAVSRLEPRVRLEGPAQSARSENRKSREAASAPAGPRRA